MSALLLRCRPRRPLACVCVLFLFIVFLLLQLVPAEEEEPPYGDRETVTVTGRLVRKEMRTDSGGAESLVCYIDTEDVPSYRVQCYMADASSMGDAEAPVGARVLVRGTVRRFAPATNPGEFDAAAYYRTIGIDFRVTGGVLLAMSGERDAVREGLYRARRALAASLDRCLDEEDAGILRAMLLGDKSAMDRDVKALYQRSGIIHILAISGLHISIIGMGLFTLLRYLRLPAPAAAGVSVLTMLAYGEMCGTTSSAVRAIIMFLLHLAAVVLGRSYDLLTALAVAAVLLVAEQPLYLTYSGFLLSFLAVLAIGALLPALTPEALAEYVPRPDDARWKGPLCRVLNGVLASLAVSLVTLPVYMLYYHTFSVYSVFLNVVILPLMSVVLGAGLCCMFAGFVCVPAGSFAGLVDHALLWLFKRLCLAENALPGAVWTTGHAAAWQIAVYYLLLAGFVACVQILRGRRRDAAGAGARIAAGGRTRRAKRSRLLRGLALRALYLSAAVALLSLRVPVALKITVLDVGQGDGIVIEGDGMRFLIDGGSTSRSAVDDYVLAPFLAYEGISHLDAAILTHEDEDHISGLLALLADEEDALTIGRLVLPRIAEESRGDNYQALVQTAAAHGIPVSTIARGETLVQGRLAVTCLGPPAGMSTNEPNAYSTVLYLTYGRFSALFTGDLEGAGEEALLAALAERPALAQGLTLLKVAHHGSRYTTSEALLARLSPQTAVISCGRNNRYGHPHEELLERLDARGIQTYITAEQGALTIETDGSRMRIAGFLDETAD